MHFRNPFKYCKSKISKILVLYIVLFSSVITLVLTAIQLRLDYNESILIIHQRIDQIEKTNLDSITQALWTMDNSSVKIQLDGLSRIADIIFVKIIDKNGNLIAASGHFEAQNTLTKSIVLERKYRGRNTSLGTLIIVGTKKNVYQKLIDTAIVILISQAVKTFLVSLFMLGIFYYLVTRHLEKIARHSEMLNLISAASVLHLERGSSNMIKGDELDRVVDAMNIMSNNIHESYNKVISSQQQLADREAKFSAMFDAMTDVIVFADSERKIIQTNPAFQKQFGYSFEEVKGQSTHILYAQSEQFKKQGKKRFNADVSKLSPLYEVEYRRKDGSVFPGETIGGPIHFSNGELVGFLGVVRDISTRKLAAEEQSILQKQLMQAQKMEAVGQLTGGIAHDFNNILASILGYAELAKDIVSDCDNPNLIKYVDRINVAGERAKELVIQLLAFSRSAPGDIKPINLPVLIDEVVALLRPGIPSSIVLNVEIDEQVPYVLMDNTQMHQILMNLCINARDAMKGSGSLTIKLEYDADVNANCNSCRTPVNGAYVKLTVQDTGTGIAPELLDHIFDPFFTTKDVGKGTGMGLSVVHGILHKHHSHILIDSRQNIGTQFHLLIPAAYENISEPDIDSSLDKFSSTVGQGTVGQGKHILVVDDEDSVVAFLQDFLKMYEYKVTATTSSRHAVELIRNSVSEFDLIITDQTMPELTGVQMIEEIFKITKDIPIILCSGYSEQVDEAKALQLGCAKYLTKPVKNQLLLKTVHEILCTG